MCIRDRRSTVRGVYDEVNDIFENPDSEYREKYAPVLGMLSDMHEMYFKLAKLQEQRGVMELEDCEPIIIVDENSMPIDIIKRERGDAEKMIEQFMLQANMGEMCIRDRRKAGPVFELPLSSLWGRKMQNLFAAGRCISADDSMWDVTRVIQVCALTGQAAGTLAALSPEKSDIQAVQSRLAEDKVRLHTSEI